MNSKCVIAICDDEENILKITTTSISVAFQQYYESVEIHSFLSVSSLDSFLNDHEMDVVFLDISMPECDGIVYAKRLRENQNNTPLVFVTSMEDRMIETFAVQPFGFIRKGSFINDLTSLASRFASQHQKEEKKDMLNLTQKGKVYSLDIHNIEYIESKERNQCLHFSDKTEPLTIAGYKLSDLAEQLEPYGFFRVHKGFIVNLFKVRMIESDGVKMASDDFVPINRKNITDFKHKFLEFSQSQNMTFFERK